MLPLNSSRWDELAASSGGSGRMAADLIGQVRAGDQSAYAELSEQLCHQFSVGEVAYAAVPHLVDLAASLGPYERLNPLRIVGAVVAARATYARSAPPIAPDLLDPYTAALSTCFDLTLASLRESWSPGELLELIAVLASLKGANELAMHIFGCGGSADLSCPQCGEYIKFTP
jgi:hypothetical protein